MNECTKGKLKREENQIVPCMTMGDNKTAITILGDTTVEKAEANAKELLRRWNAFEDGGLVEELRTACEKIRSIEKHRRKSWQGWDSEIDVIAEAALAKS